MNLSRRALGQTGLQVTPLCIGCAPLGNMPETFAYGVTQDQALATLTAALASPINFLDTAASYGDGESERRLGLAIRAQGGMPTDTILATKADRDLQTGEFSGDQIKRSVERSLRLLGLERLPLVYLHDPEHAPFEVIMATGGAVEVLQDFKRQRVIGHLGLAGGPTDLMMRYLETGAFEVAITHNRYTLLNRSGEPLIALAHRLGLGILNAAPYGSGLLAKGPDAYPRYAYQDAPPAMIDQVRRMARLCQEHGVSLAAAALQFSLRDPRLHSTIVGISKPERIAQTLELAATPIPPDLWSKLDAVGFSREDPEADRWQPG